jgi:hypothetical protein
MAAPGPKQMLLQAMDLLFKDRDDDFKAAAFKAIHKMDAGTADWLVLKTDSLKRAMIIALIGDGGLPGICRPEVAAGNVLGVLVLL